ncbi:uncharacterized protein [Rutidosis leptorrhynchoides]|uniref:uncharacterized protein n=1 Tax=Rutidosis leptorrhynchoides TaxID=125765 RepID=UPI003A99072B
MSDQPKYHPALTVSNIKNMIPITLELNKSQYNSWSQLFKIHCRAYDVVDHITPKSTDSSSSTGTTPVTPDPLWDRRDAIVLQWIYGTISDDLRETIMENESDAAAAWT